jgi:hypothetical protein
MAADFILKQNIRMSPNAQIKNLVPENLIDIPPMYEWKLGRIWFNVSIGKLQGIFLKLDKDTGLPIKPEEMEIRVVGADALGQTKDGSFWPDGLFDFTEQTKIADAMDDVNEALKDLAPPAATMLRGDLYLCEQQFITGKVSIVDHFAPHDVILSDITPGDEINYIVSNPHIKATLPTTGLVVKGKQQQQFGRADQGIMTVVLNGVKFDDGIDLGYTFFEKGRDYSDVFQGYDHTIDQIITTIDGRELSVEVNPNKDNYRSSTGILTINTIERYNDFKKWQRGSGTVEFDVSPGKYNLHVEHDCIISGQHQQSEIITDPFKTNTLLLFFDPSTIKPTTKVSKFKVASGSTKFVSGVQYYNTDISFSFDFLAKNLFDYTYWDEPISIVMDGSKHNLLKWNSSESTLKNSTVPVWNDTFGLSSYTIEYKALNTIVNTINVTTKAGKPITGWGTETNTNVKVLVDTYPIFGNSTTLKETFIDEQYRLDINMIDVDNISSVSLHSTNTWDSEQQLTSGNAHQFMGNLIKARLNMNEYGVNVDYSSFAAENSVYYRRIFANNKPNSNGLIKIETNGKIGLDFDVNIRFPSITGWLNVTELFDVEIFKENFNMDGIGCATSITKTKTGYEFGWTIGQFSTVTSDFGYLVKITIKSDSCVINELEEIASTWR